LKGAGHCLGVKVIVEGCRSLFRGAVIV